ncbi:hypothetical protein PENTCL1PPCAC_29323, partial [Pristionchus entomophagus]
NVPDPATSCRKCRFDRFSSIMQRAYGPTPRPKEQEKCQEELYEDQSNDEPAVINDRQFTTMSTTAFIDHTELFEIESASRVPLLERIRRGYSMFCLMRKLGETSMQSMSFCTEAGFKRDQVNFIPATWSNSIKYCRVYVEALFDFAPSAFDDYRTLSCVEKKIFTKNSYALVGGVTSAYRSLHHFPNDETMFINYTTTLNYEPAASFFDLSSSDSNMEEAIRS